jgi:hypothetical protein
MENDSCWWMDVARTHPPWWSSRTGISGVIEGEFAHNANLTLLRAGLTGVYSLKDAVKEDHVSLPAHASLLLKQIEEAEARPLTEGPPPLTAADAEITCYWNP